MPNGDYYSVQVRSAQQVVLSVNCDIGQAVYVGRMSRLCLGLGLCETPIFKDGVSWSFPLKYYNKNPPPVFAPYPRCPTPQTPRPVTPPPAPTAMATSWTTMLLMVRRLTLSDISLDSPFHSHSRCCTDPEEAGPCKPCHQRPTVEEK